MVMELHGNTNIHHTSRVCNGNELTSKLLSCPAAPICTHFESDNCNSTTTPPPVSVGPDLGIIEDEQPRNPDAAGGGHVDGTLCTVCYVTVLFYFPDDFVRLHY